MITVHHRFENNICIINLAGEVNQDSVEEIITRVKKIIKGEEFQGFVINFENMIQIDSQGIGMLMQLFKDFEDRQIKLAFCHLSDSLSEFFTMSLIDRVISTHSTEEEALASFE